MKSVNNYYIMFMYLHWSGCGQKEQYQILRKYNNVAYNIKAVSSSGAGDGFDNIHPKWCTPAQRINIFVYIFLNVSNKLDNNSL